MNRVRVVALSAVALGVVVAAGTKFQQSRESVDMVSEQTAVLSAAQIAIQQAPSLALADASVSGAQSASAPSVTQASTTTGQAQPVLAQPVLAQPALTQPARPPLAAETVGDDNVRRAVRLSEPVEQASMPQPAVVEPAPRLASASILSAVDIVAATAVAETAETPPVIAPIDPELEAELAACAVWVVVTPSPGAMMDTSVYAPCDRDALVQVGHAGLSFDTRIGANGQLMVSIPALIDDATVTVTFADGRSQSDTTFINDLAAVERVALQWSGAAELALHAYEFGAQFGDAGHIHAANAMAPGNLDHGFLTALGDPRIGGTRVQVYSYPTLQAARSGSVALEIEAPITELSCGKPLVATSIEMNGASAVRSRVINVDMPACDGTGGYVVVPGILPDLQIAALR